MRPMVYFDLDTKSPDAWVDYCLSVSSLEHLCPAARAELVVLLREVARKVESGEYGPCKGALVEADEDSPGPCRGEGEKR